MSNTFLKFNSPDLGVLPRFRCLMRLAMMRASVSGKRQWKAGNRLISRTGVENTLTIDSIDYRYIICVIYTTYRSVNAMMKPARSFSRMNTDFASFKRALEQGTET